MDKILLVGLGGALGAVLRYLISLIPLKTAFPFLTLATNFAGAVLIGFIIGAAEERKVGDKALIFLKTGVCGGFTTFSTFSAEALNLFENGKNAEGGIYIVVSILGCILGVMLGKSISKLIFCH